jgi:hypothetical protein
MLSGGLNLAREAGYTHSGLADQPTPMPWLEDKNLVIDFA